MQLNRSTDYALRMLICLSRASGAVSSSKLARAIGVSPRYLLQIGARLRDAGFVHVGHGPAGGYQLSRPPAKISLMDVIMAVNRKENVSVLPDKRRSKEDFHILECTYRQLEKGIQRQLESITISELSQTECEESDHMRGVGLPMH